ncbi:MAG: archaemetzincin family Zn-dependent metalloprotease [Thermoproteota archaeon]|jgi:Predicted Zn-dependent proteases
MNKIRIFFTYKDELAEKCILEALSEVYSAPVELYHTKINVSKAYDSRRNQFDAIKLLEENRRLENYLFYTLIVYDQDIFVSYLNYVFGLAMGKLAIISTYRLKINAQQELYCQRCKKEAVHEIGHLVGLSHCLNKNCVMYFSNSIFDTDNKSYKFCEDCRKKLGII